MSKMRPCNWRDLFDFERIHFSMIGLSEEVWNNLSDKDKVKKLKRMKNGHKFIN